MIVTEKSLKREKENMPSYFRPRMCPFESILLLFVFVFHFSVEVIPPHFSVSESFHNIEQIAKREQILLISFPETGSCVGGQVKAGILINIRAFSAYLFS